MAWIVVDLDGTLVQEGEITPEMMDPQAAAMGQPPSMPVEGAVEAMNQLAAEGHRLSVWTARFAPMPESERNRLKEQIEGELASYGFPPMEVWTGTTKPDGDVYIDDKAVTFDGDWGLALAQTSMMLEERGLAPGPQPDDGMVPQGEEVPEEVPQE
jgi:hypothetical protein